jgi:micrococcal nuclease
MRENTNESRTWRKWPQSIALLSLLLVVPLAGCGDASSTDGGAKQKDQKEQATSEKKEDLPSKEELEAEYGEVNHPESELADITEEVTVSRVIDGDTIVISGKKGEETVQLALSDTPELILPDGKQDEYYGFKSNEYAAMLQGSKVRLERAGNQKNEEGHAFGYIWMKNGVDHVNFNKLLLQEGLARLAEETDPNSKYMKEFGDAESQAKAEQKYIWSAKGYVTDNGFDPSRVK